MTKHLCAKCGKPVVVRPDRSIERQCDHKDASVIAECSAKVVGKGKLR